MWGSVHLERAYYTVGGRTRPPRVSDFETNLAPQRERPPELDPDLRHASALQCVCSITRRTRLTGAKGCQMRVSFMASTPVVDPLLRHLDRVGISILLGVEHDVGRRQHRKDAHHRLRAPSVTVRLVRLRLDPPALVLDVGHVRLRSLRLRPARVRAIGEADVADADLLTFAGHARVAVRVFRTERGVEARRHLPTLSFRRGSFGSEPSPVRRRHRPAWRYFPLLLPQYPRALGVGRRSRGEQVERDEQRGPSCESGHRCPPQRLSPHARIDPAALANGTGRASYPIDVEAVNS